LSKKVVVMRLPIIVRLRKFAFPVATIASLLVANGAMAGTVNVTVDSTAGPWLNAVNSSFTYGIGDNTAPTIVSGLTAGESVTISYISGLTSAFGGVPPAVDANGYIGSIFTSDNPGSSGQPLPGFYTASPVDVVLNELIGTFADAAGHIIGTPFAIGNGPLTLSDPSGATQIQLGINDDIFVNSGLPGAIVPDNTGSLLISVSADSISSATPLPAALPLFATGLGALGLLGWRRKRKAQAAA
jgi:hypothetical protein